MNNSAEEKTGHDQMAADLLALRETVKQQGYALAKWGRVLNSLIALLEEKGIVTKSEIMTKVYEALRDSGALDEQAIEQGGDVPCASNFRRSRLTRKR